MQSLESLGSVAFATVCLEGMLRPVLRCWGKVNKHDCVNCFEDKLLQTVDNRSTHAHWLQLLMVTCCKVNILLRRGPSILKMQLIFLLVCPWWRWQHVLGPPGCCRACELQGCGLARFTSWAAHRGCRTATDVLLSDCQYWKGTALYGQCGVQNIGGVKAVVACPEPERCYLLLSG